MSRLVRKRYLRVIAAVEPLEPRQLLHSGPLLLKEAAVALTGNADLGPWGRLKLVDRLENQGDHQFDAIGERLTAKFNRWALHHPTLAHDSGFKPTPVGSWGSSIPTTQVAYAAPPPQFNLVPADHSHPSHS